jgi:hypothetical protein
MRPGNLFHLTWLGLATIGSTVGATRNAVPATIGSTVGATRNAVPATIGSTVGSTRVLGPATGLRPATDSARPLPRQAIQRGRQFLGVRGNFGRALVGR